MELFDQILELGSQGFGCAQILLILGMEEEDTNIEIIRAMDGLNGGLGYTMNVCGILTGGCCLLGYFLGRGEEEEEPTINLTVAIHKYVEWFQEKYGEAVGGCECHRILDGSMSNKLQRCPPMVEEAFIKIMNIIEEVEQDDE